MKLTIKNTETGLWLQPITIGEYIYAVSNDKPTFNDYGIGHTKGMKKHYLYTYEEINSGKMNNLVGGRKVIATNNPNLVNVKQFTLPEEVDKSEKIFSFNDYEKFTMWREENRWYNYNKNTGLWSYTHQHGTVIPKNLEHKFRKTIEELYQMYLDDTIVVIEI